MLPATIAESCKAAGRPYFVLALEGFADPAFASQHPHGWQGLAKVGHAVDMLKNAGCKSLVLAGSVQRPSLSALKPDFQGMKLMGRIAMLKNQGDDALLTALMSYLEEQGFAIEKSHEIVKHLTVNAGSFTPSVSHAYAEDDIGIGVEFLKMAGFFDVGQAVIVQQKKIIAVEGAEGTDGMLARVKPLLLKGDKAVLVKTSKPTQDVRADLPTVGPETIKNAAAAGLGGVAIEAGKTLILNSTATVEAADKSGLFFVAV